MISESLNFAGSSMQKAQLNLVFPSLFALWMAWSDIKTNRIPNYLTIGCALTGLGYQLGSHGWRGLTDGFLGMSLGFALLIFFYARGGMGAGDVKALASLGAWLGPLRTIFLSIYMALSGVLVLVIFLWWRGLLWGKIRQLWCYLANWILCYSCPTMPDSITSSPKKSEGIPYAVAMAMGMAILCGLEFYKLTFKLS